MRIPLGLRAAAGAAGAAGAGGGEAWDISGATFNGTPINSFSVSTEEGIPEGLFFKPDGTKMYILGSSGDEVNEYNLSTSWDISTANYVQNFSVATEELAPHGIFFKPDGAKMYIIGVDGDDVNEYSLSTAWDISTASYAQNFSVATEDTVPRGIFLKPDGTKMYIAGGAGIDVNEYSLSTAWDVSTASYVQNFFVGSEEATLQDVFFKSDGTKMYIIGSDGDDVNEYSLSTAWDISTCSYVQNFSVLTQMSAPNGMFFKDDGTEMYITGSGPSSVFKYNLSSAWDISTASFVYPTSNFFYVGAEETNPRGMFFKPDGTKMYVGGSSGDDVNEYNLTTAWDVSTASYAQNFSVATEESTPTGIFLKPDGTKMYVAGSAGDDVNEYSLSSAWDISTASYVQNFSVAAEETVVNGLFFKPDGTKMYILGSSGDDVNEYSLSTAWDVSTASYVQNFSVATEDTGPLGLFFKDDGTRMYVMGSSSDSVHQYNLSTGWDISTSSYIQGFNVGALEASPRAIFFKSDGSKFYVLGSFTDAVWSYDL